MSHTLEELQKTIHEVMIKGRAAKKRREKNAEKKREKFLSKHGEEIVEIEEPQIAHGIATTTKAKITRNELAKLIDYNSNDYVDKYYRKILMTSESK
jgi:TRAP-type C4-dicarboxylate transport system substrate-binding protein